MIGYRPHPSLLGGTGGGSGGSGVDQTARDAVAASDAVIQSSRLATTRADLDVVWTDLASARADVARVSRDRTTAIVVMAHERDRAVTAEQEAARLRTRIAKDAGTTRDGEVAPVLRDALEALQKTASRQDSLYLGRRPDVWLLLVIVDGRITRRDYARDEKTCRDVAMVAALELAARPELVSDPGRVRISCTPSRPGGAA